MSAPAPVLLAPVTARRPQIDRSMAANEALRIILLDCLAQVRANAPVVEARNSEGLHQLRVGLRRLRTALTLVKSKPFAALERRAKTIINRVGPARDLDVFVSELFLPAVEELGARRGFEILAARSTHARDKAWRTAFAEVTSTTFQRFNEDMAAAARDAILFDDQTIATAAPALLDHAMKRTKKRGRHYEDLDPPSRHRLRIALKKLRYGSEFFAPLYPKKSVKHWLDPLKDLQDQLGLLNDVAAVRGVIARLMLEEAESAAVQADLSHAAGLLQGFHQARGDAIAEKTIKQWKAFRDADPFWI